MTQWDEQRKFPRYRRRPEMEAFEPTPRKFGGEDSKSSDPASGDDRTKLAEGTPGSASDLLGPPAANRHRLQNERSAITHHFAFGGHEGYLTVGFYQNGQPGEIFIRMAKAGSTIAGLMECFGTVVSVSLQHGVPLKVLCDKLSHTRFEPSGWTGNAQIEYAKSIMDYLFRWMELRFLSGKQLSLFGQGNGEISAGGKLTSGPVDGAEFVFDIGDALPCAGCGGLMKPSGTCYTCVNCGQTSGCS
jgi:ribonucleoside-diphosphate reductase alpha chain